MPELTLAGSTGPRLAYAVPILIGTWGPYGGADPSSATPRRAGRRARRAGDSHLPLLLVLIAGIVDFALDVSGVSKS